MFILVDFHGDIEFALLSDELERALDGFDGEIERDLVFVLIGTFPFKDELGLGIWAWLVVDFVFVDVVFRLMEHFGVAHLERGENDESVAVLIAIVSGDAVGRILRHGQLID